MAKQYLSATMDTEKRHLREVLGKKRNSISVAIREQAGITMVERLRSLPAYQKASTVCGYVSMRSEVPTAFLLRQLWQDGKQLFLPRTTATPGIMEMVAVEATSPLVTGAFGVQEPADSLPAAQHVPFDLVIVPALAYDLHGYRLGYGGGYYDRFLSHMPPSTITIGLCYHELLLPALPHNRQDCSVHIILTEQEIIDLS